MPTIVMCLKLIAVTQAFLNGVAAIFEPQSCHVTAWSPLKPTMRTPLSQLRWLAPPLGTRRSYSVLAASGHFTASEDSSSESLLGILSSHPKTTLTWEWVSLFILELITYLSGRSPVTTVVHTYGRG